MTQYFSFENVEHYYSYEKLEKMIKLSKAFIDSLPPTTMIDLSIILSMIAYSAADPKSPRRDYMDFTCNMKDLYPSIAKLLVESD